MRRFINDVKAKGAHPILFSLTPRNAWEDKDSTIITRVNKTFGLWAKQVAEEQNVPFIDLNDISAQANLKNSVRTKCNICSISTVFIPALSELK